MVSALESVRRQAEELTQGFPPTHDWTHNLRVLKTVEMLATRETRPVNMEVLQLATYLHDIARKIEDDLGGKIDHAKKSAEMAAEILQKEGYSHDMIERVSHCIRAHRFRKNDGDEHPQSVEAEILYDADKLECIGAIGVARSFMFAGENHYQLYRELSSDYDGLTREKDPKKHTANIEFEVKLKHIKNKLITPVGRKMGEKRHYFMEQFFKQLEEEVKGQR
ncbi:MAG: HD domain-containing protein [Promethearchaeota archaeon]